MSATRTQSGFTLIEMLVALSLFAMLSAAGVALLRGSVDTQDAVQRHLSGTAGINRLYALLAQDAAQALPRPTRDAAGNIRAAFVGDSSGFALVRGGASLSDDRPGTARVFVRFANGELRRGVQSAADGIDPAAGDVLLRNVAQATFRYRLADGGWASTWTASDLAIWPRAIELVVAPRGRPAMTMVVALPTPPPPVVVPVAPTP
ncbi:MAG: hypothetical protein RLZZ58_1404 [Pseudomonadota bacterium]